MTEKKHVLLVLSTSGTPIEAVVTAVEKAKEASVGLVALYILETDLSNELFDRFSDIGFIGDRPSTQLSEAVMKEYRQRGYEELGVVQVKTMEESVDFEPVMETGAYVETVLQHIKLHNCSLVILVKRKENALFKYFSRSLTDEIKAKAACEVIEVCEK